MYHRYNNIRARLHMKTHYPGEASMSDCECWVSRIGFWYDKDKAKSESWPWPAMFNDEVVDDDDEVVDDDDDDTTIV